VVKSVLDPVTQACTTVLVGHRKYDGFGSVTEYAAIGAGAKEITASGTLGGSFTYAFTGRPYEQCAGLYYYRARWYDSVTGRFLSEDPSGFAAGPNLFAYCGNNPVNETDPSGLCGSSTITTTAGLYSNVGFGASATYAGLFGSAAQIADPTLFYQAPNPSPATVRPALGLIAGDLFPGFSFDDPAEGLTPEQMGRLFPGLAPFSDGSVKPLSRNTDSRVLQQLDEYKRLAGPVVVHGNVGAPPPVGQGITRPTRTEARAVIESEEAGKLAVANAKIAVGAVAVAGGSILVVSGGMALGPAVLVAYSELGFAAGAAYFSLPAWTTSPWTLGAGVGALTYAATGDSEKAIQAAAILPLIFAGRASGDLAGAYNRVRTTITSVAQVGLPDASRFGSVTEVGLDLTDPALGQTLANSRPVVFRPPTWATRAEIAQMQAYVDGANDALLAGALSPTGRVSTVGTLREAADAAAAAERLRAAAAGTPYGQMQAGHVPDTTWTGNPQPHSWLPLSRGVNSSLGSQATRYPVGTKPTGFYLDE
jgi:RHS repeat-associated protein